MPLIISARGGSRVVVANRAFCHARMRVSYFEITILEQDLDSEGAASAASDAAEARVSQANGHGQRDSVERERRAGVGGGDLHVGFFGGGEAAVGGWPGLRRNSIGLSQSSTSNLHSTPPPRPRTLRSDPSTSNLLSTPTPRPRTLRSDPRPQTRHLQACSALHLNLMHFPALNAHGPCPSPAEPCRTLKGARQGAAGLGRAILGPGRARQGPAEPC